MSSGYDSGSGTGSAVDTDAGASGNSGGFSLSQGGLIAIIVIVVLVVIFGTTSTILYVVAKRRQWNIRASIARASRRFTGRGGTHDRDRTTDRQSKRAGIQLDSRPARSGHKRGLVVQVQDVEKGQPSTNSETKEDKTWDKKMTANDWR